MTHVQTNNPYVAYNLRELYHEFGEYEFKVVLGPDVFKNSHDSSIEMIDSDGKVMSFEVKKWGRKMNCSFSIGPDVADGVATIKLSLQDEDGKIHVGRLFFWVVKP